eukprot:TRINITY_DN1628_c5_g1_i3.p1 TRINITY_DN1628_c5_g1~~TRINITY_DN1628_c5_g1_i3.p1  ORF type:complete len:334 (-),score=25.44 TRINITY_DN1628_c5_g1_i3:48-1049(-)
MDKRHNIAWQDLDKGRFYLMSGVALLGVRALVFPAILVKTRLQVQKEKAQYKGTFDAFRKIFRVEGFRGFYKGFMTATVGVLPAQYTYITAYELSRHKLRSYTDSEWLCNFLGGGTASVCSSLVGVPLDVMSQLQMIQDGVVNKQRYTGGLHVASEIFKREGIYGFYKGYFASIMVYAPSSAIWWSSYNLIKNEVMFVVDHYSPFGGKLDLLFYALSGAGAGACAAILTNPLDVAKTRLQVLAFADRRGTTGHDMADAAKKATNKQGTVNFWSVIRELWATEGPGAFKRGLSARVMSMMPISFLLVLNYETVKRYSVRPDAVVEDHQPTHKAT